MFPLMGLLLVFVPLGGLLLALALLFVRRLRFLAPFAFFVPLLGSYSAVAGFWGVGIGLELLGLHSGIFTGLAALLGMLAFCAFGTVIGVAVAFGFNRFARYAWTGLLKK